MNSLAKILILALLVFASCSSPGTVKVGAILHLSANDYADVGVAMQEGIELHLDEINAQGGIQGKTLVVLYEDSQLDLKQTVTAARKLISVDNVTAIIVSTYGEAMAIAPVTEEAGVPVIVLWDANEELNDAGQHVFGMGVWTENSGTRIAEYAIHDLKLRNIAIISHNTEWSSTVTDFFIGNFTTQGGNITSWQEVDADTTDFRTSILKAIESDPQAIFAPVDRRLETFFRQLREVGYANPILTLESLTQQAIDASGNATEDVYFTNFAVPADYSETTELEEKYRAKYGHEPRLFIYTGFGYDGLLAVTEAMKYADDSTHKELSAALYAMPPINGSFGTIKFDAEGSSPRYQSVFQIQEGKQVLVKN